MSFEDVKIEEEITTDETIKKEGIMVDERDLEQIDKIIDDIENEKVTEKWTLKEYNVQQMKNMLSDPNKHLTAMDMGVDDDKVSDEDAIGNFVKKDDYGFSLAFRFALRNEQFRGDMTKEDLLKGYKKMRKEIEIGLEKYKQDQEKK